MTGPRGLGSDFKRTAAGVVEEVVRQYGVLRELQRGVRKAEHQVEKLLEVVQSGDGTTAERPAPAEPEAGR